MKLSPAGRLSALAAAAAFLMSPVAHAQGAPPPSPSDAAALGQQAYLYGFPLLEFLRVRKTATSVRCPDAKGDTPVNSFSNATRFATPAERTIVAPNVDTLYSIAHLDLGRGPVVLSHPDMGHRYFVFQLLDSYTNTIGYVGTRTTGTHAGRFAITWPGHRGRKVRGAAVLRSPSRRVWVIGRTLASGRADQRRALRLMRRYRLAPPGGPRRFSKGCRPGPPKRATTPTGLAFLDALGSALKRNPPPARDRPLLKQLATVGVGPGLRPEKAGLPEATLASLVASVNTIATALPQAAKSTLDGLAAGNHGWAIPAKNIGNYGTDYRYRAGVASLGLGANTREEAVYPTALRDSAGQPLNGNSRYRIVFPKGQLPPARAFWSLTLYDADGYLVSNAQKRYAIGSSHPPLRRRADGSVVVVLQRTKPTEPNVNWLPTPAGPFRLNLRLYMPTPRVLSGAWQPPPVVNVAAAAADRHVRARGPALGIARSKLATGLTCSPGFAKARVPPVLLTPAFSSAAESYGWNYIPQLTADRIPFCSISVPDEGYGDLQKTAEYVVFAVRRMSRITGHRVTLLGHQHGGLDELWALTFWPDVARSVSDLVSLETPYAGTTSSAGLCTADGHCTAALRQITKGSRFLAALRAAPRPKGVAITSISSKNDALITPQPAASRLPGAHHVLLQRVCPGREVDHFAALADNVAYRLFRDARSHRGPASAGRLRPGVCAAQYMPAADPGTLAFTGVFLSGFFARNAASNDREPKIAAYARRLKR